MYSIVYGLAEWNHDLALHLEKLVTATPDILNGDIATQFKDLVLRPLAVISAPSKTVVFVVDALDGKPCYVSGGHDVLCN